METSAKASINVEDAFFTLARDIKAKMDKKMVRMTLLLCHTVLVEIYAGNFFRGFEGANVYVCTNTDLPLIILVYKVTLN